MLRYVANYTRHPRHDAIVVNQFNAASRPDFPRNLIVGAQPGGASPRREGPLNLKAQ